jgi:hypothetical protein
MAGVNTDAAGQSENSPQVMVICVKSRDQLRAG